MTTLKILHYKLLVLVSPKRNFTDNVQNSLTKCVNFTPTG